MICALVMAGGKGTRFWPVSTKEKPKQFLSLLENRTMIEMTIDRIRPIIPIERIFVATNERYVDLLRNQIKDLPRENIIVEPEGRNTAPCITLASLIIKRRFGDATLLVLASDHLIEKEEKFRELILLGKKFVEKNMNSIITLGINPTRPETGYGYIKYIDENNNSNINRVEAFIEKPSYEKAKEYFSEGKYLWNSGMFIWKINLILNKIKNNLPNTYEALENIQTIKESEIKKFIFERYCRTDSISIDYAVLERSDNIFVIKSNIGWDDIGSWNSIERYKEIDKKNNVIVGNVKSFDSKNNMIYSTNKKIVLNNIEGIYVIETEDKIVIGKKSEIDLLSKLRVELGE